MSELETGKPVESTVSRRGFVEAGIGVLGVCYAAAFGYPMYQYLATPAEEAEMEAAVKEVTLKGADKLPKNSAMVFKFGGRPAMLIRHPDGSWSALTAVCTHLGCTVAYEPDTQHIHCACHGGTYDSRTGANISGPPPKPLKTYKVLVAQGKVVVSRV